MPETASRPYRNSLTGRRVMRSIDVPLLGRPLARSPAFPAILHPSSLRGDVSRARDFRETTRCPPPFFFKFLKIVEFLSTIGAREERVNSDICYKVYMRERERERGATIETNRSDRLSFQSPIWRGEEEEKEEEKRERTANNRA